ncbi:MAG: hypothetical protein HYV77_03500 [Candidatus Wildermuthbacteria bacterium]|nr:hypothetical protein [Candidatus Wildermuthbacteria bacterium]
MEKFEQPRKEERNLEKDRSTFVEAVEGTQILEIGTEFDESTVKILETELADTKIFLLGETHGVKENPDIIYTLFKKFGFRNLALEWEPTLKEKIERFLNGEAIDFDSIKDSPDGRITAGHFALLKKLKEEGLLEKFVCFDQGGGASWDKRDENMARNIIENLTDAPTLVVAGNLHTKVEPITFEDEEGEHHPMGEQVKRDIPNVPSGRIEYLTGEFHNYGTRKFGEKSDDAKFPLARFFKGEDGLYVFELPEAHVAVVPNPSKSLS